MFLDIRSNMTPPLNYMGRDKANYDETGRDGDRTREIADENVKERGQKSLRAQKERNI